MMVLGIDTATMRGSVALARPGGVLAAAPLPERGAYARDLLARIDALLNQAGLRPAELRGIAATLGPGSFTGVRIGLSTAKGLAYALGIGLAGLSTLEAVARAVPAPGEGTLCAALEAGRGEVFAALFQMVGGEPRRETDDRSWRPLQLAKSLPHGTRVVGDASASIERAAREAGTTIEVIELPALLAGPLALWGCRALTPGAPYLPGLKPNYVRPSDVEGPRR